MSAVPPARKRSVHVVTAYAAIVLLYVMFFMSPVSPARPQETFDFEVEASKYADIPSIYGTVYTNGKAFLAIATIRSIAAPDPTYSMAFDRMGGYAERFLRDNYGIDVELREERTERSYAIGGHVGTRTIFGIYMNISFGGVSETSQVVKVAEMGAVAWFCNVDFESVVMFYVSPVYFLDDPSLQALSNEVSLMVGSVACH